MGRTNDNDKDDADPNYNYYTNQQRNYHCHPDNEYYETNTTTTSNPPFNLVVVGNSCKINKNDSMASYIHNGHHLLTIPTTKTKTTTANTYDGPPLDDMNETMVIHSATTKSTTSKNSCSTTTAAISSPHHQNYDETNNAYSDSIYFKLDPHDVRLLLQPDQLFNFSISKSHHDLDHSVVNNTDHFQDDNDNKRIKTKKEQQNELEAELNFERYHMLPKHNTNMDDKTTIAATTTTTTIHANKDIHHEYKIPISSGKHNDSNNILNVTVEFSKEDDSHFLQWIDNEKEKIIMPKTKRQYEIMKKTSKNTHQNPQFQVLLKLKQSHNPDFGFLNHNHQLFPLYQYMFQRWTTLESDPHNENNNNNPEGNNAKNNTHDENDLSPTSNNKDLGSNEVVLDETNMHMTGLIGLYSSSDEEDDAMYDKLEDPKNTSHTENTCLDQCDKDEQKNEIGNSYHSSTISKIDNVIKSNNDPISSVVEKHGEVSQDASTSMYLSSCPVPSKLTNDNNEDISLRIQELRSKRLKRARLKKEHFVQKMMHDKG